MCKTGADSGSRTGAKQNLDRIRSNHELTDNTAGGRKLGNTDAHGGWRVHTVLIHTYIHSTGHTQRERRDKSQTLQLHSPRGMTAEGGSMVKEEWDKTGRGSHDGDMIRQKRREVMKAATLLRRKWTRGPCIWVCTLAKDVLTKVA